MTKIEYQATITSTARHHIEEAMTKAVVRYCPKCKKGPCEKDEGCNSVNCTGCSYRFCFACGEGVGNEYASHFGGDKPCPLFDNTKERLEREAADAQDRTVTELLDTRPELHEADLIVDQSAWTRRFPRVSTDGTRVETAVAGVEVPAQGANPQYPANRLRQLPEAQLQVRHIPENVETGRPLSCGFGFSLMVVFVLGTVGGLEALTFMLIKNNQANISIAFLYCTVAFGFYSFVAFFSFNIVLCVLGTVTGMFVIIAWKCLENDCVTGCGLIFAETWLVIQRK